jgi:hypothetical protein
MPRAAPPDPPDDLESRIDRLFGLPLDQFVAERNALAAALRRERRAADSARVKGLTRPSLPAWAVNQVFWQARADFDRLTAAGDRMREAQRQALGGRDVDQREPSRERQQAVRAFVDRAVALMRAAGQTVTDATRQRIAVSADAIAAYGSRPRAYRPGRMEQELDPPGFETLAALASGAPPLRLVKPARDERPSTPSAPGGAAGGPAAPEEKTRARALADAEREAGRRRREALKEARTSLEAQERELERAQRIERGAAAGLKELRAELDPLRRQLATLEKKVQAAESELDAAQTRVTALKETVEAARDEIRRLRSADDTEA